MLDTIRAISRKPMRAVNTIPPQLLAEDRTHYGGESLETIAKKIAFIRDNGRFLRTIECNIEFWACGPHVWCIRSATQYNYSGEYHRWGLYPNNEPTGGLDAAMRAGRKAGRIGGICYDEYSDTLRQWPQNYLLAVRSRNRPYRFAPTPDAASTINGHSLGIVLEQFADSPTPQVLAAAVDCAFYQS